MDRNQQQAPAVEPAQHNLQSSLVDRADVAEGDASPATIRTYHAQAAQFVAWCQQQGFSPSTATENGIIAYRKHLVEAG